MAGETNLPSGRVALRSYGSISYAGLLSYIYADLKKDDPRVQAEVLQLEPNEGLIRRIIFRHQDPGPRFQ